METNFTCAPDGVVPAFSPEWDLAAMERFQHQGKLPLLRWKLAGKGISLIERARNPDYDKRLRSLRAYVAQSAAESIERATSQGLGPANPVSSS